MKTYLKIFGSSQIARWGQMRQLKFPEWESRIKKGFIRSESFWSWRVTRNQIKGHCRIAKVLLMDSSSGRVNRALADSSKDCFSMPWIVMGKSFMSFCSMSFHLVSICWVSCWGCSDKCHSAYVSLVIATSHNVALQNVCLLKVILLTVNLLIMLLWWVSVCLLAFC